MTLIDRRTVLLGGIALAGSAGRARAAPEPAALARLREDPRLAKPVTLRLKRAPLPTALDAIQQATAVELRASPDVADDPAVVFVHDQPAREVMRQLALLFNYQWRRSGPPGAYRYQLYQDASSRRAEQALREADRGRVIAAVREQIRLSLALIERSREDLRRDLQDALRALQHPPLPPAAPDGAPPDSEAEAWRWRAGIHRLQAALDPHQRAFLKLAAAFTGEQWRLLVGEGKIVFSTRDEPEAWLLPSEITRTLRASPPAASEPPLAARPEDQERYDEEERRRTEQERDAWSRAEGFRLYCRLDLKENSPPLRAQFSITAGAMVPEREWTVQARGLDLFTSPDQTDEPAKASLSPEEAAKDPLLSRSRAWVLDQKPDQSPGWWNGWLTRVLPSLAERYDLNLVADAYRIQRARPPAIRADEELRLYDSLNRYLLRAAAWTRDGEFLRIRRRRWYTVRLTEIPDRAAREWAGFLRARSRLSLGDLVDLVIAFRDLQLDETFAPVMEEQGIELPECLEEIDNETHPGARDLLRATGALPAALKRRLLEGNPVPAAAMPPEARTHLSRSQQQWFPFLSPPRAQLAAGALRLQLWDAERVVTQNDDGYHIDYRIAGDHELPSEGGHPLFPSRFARRITMPDLFDPPPPGGQAVQVAHFRYTYGADKLMNWRLILPWIHLLPRPAAPAREGPR